LKILVTVLFPDVHGPLQKIMPGLMEGLFSAGCTIGTEPWGRHHNNESLHEKVFSRFQDIIRICRRLKRERFDVLLLQTAHDWNTLIRDVLLIFFAGSHRPVTIAQLHGSRSDWLTGPGHLLFKLATRVFLMLTDSILLLSQEELKEWRAFYPNINAYLVSNPFISKQNALCESNPLAFSKTHHDVPVLLFVGRLMFEKGIFDLLDAMAIVKQTTHCHLLVVGEGPEKERVKKRIGELSLESSVTLTGYLSGDDLTNAYLHSDVFVLPTFWAEGFPTVITEAMNAGLPIVTTRVRGNADHLTEGRNTLFVAPKDPRSLAQTLLKLMADSDLRTKMSKINKAEVKKFRPDLVAPEYVRALRLTPGR